MARGVSFLLVLVFLICYSIGKQLKDDVDTIVDSKDAVEKKINELNKERIVKASAKKDDKELVKDERKFRNLLKSNIKKYGKNSKEVSKTLNDLGRALYLQGKLEEALDVSVNVLAITEHIYAGAATGLDDDIEDQMYDNENIAMSLGNVANVAFKLQLTELVDLTSNRQLYIVLKVYGEKSKEDVRQRAIMLQHEVKSASDIEYTGMRYKEYKKLWIAWNNKRKNVHSILDEL